ncbi:MAG: hypothetical protein PHU71_04170 [Candidatus Gracilibacteria bacterium]|nr:hypothetical protein [Candidatus Gracilibacteria bacterium]
MNEKLKNFIGWTSLVALSSLFSLAGYLNKDDIHNRMCINTRTALKAIFTTEDTKLLTKVNKDCANAKQEIVALREKLKRLSLQGPNGEKLSIELEVDCDRDWVNLPPAHICIIDAHGDKVDELNAENWIASGSALTPGDAAAQFWNGLILSQEQQWALVDETNF